MFGGVRGEGGTPKPSQNIALEVKPFKKLMFGVPIWGIPGRVVPPNYVKVFVSLLSPDIKKVAPKLKPSKKLIYFGVHLGFLKGFLPPNYVKIFLCFKFLLIAKKTSALAYGVKKVILGESSQRMKPDTL